MIEKIQGWSIELRLAHYEQVTEGQPCEIEDHLAHYHGGFTDEAFATQLYKELSKLLAEKATGNPDAR